MASLQQVVGSRRLTKSGFLLHARPPVRAPARQALDTETGSRPGLDTEVCIDGGWAKPPYVQQVFNQSLSLCAASSREHKQKSALRVAPLATSLRRSCANGRRHGYGCDACPRTVDPDDTSIVLHQVPQTWSGSRVEA